MHTPILFLIFNRPQETQKVFEAIRKVQPNQLFVAADGPRTNKIGEKDICAQTRAIVNGIDWDCKVTTLFREDNLGCRHAVSSAIDWFFSQVPEGIILEDDCIPDPSFFSFCETLLEKYRFDTRIMHICGSNFQFGNKRGEASYYFSRYNHVWGWASWSRAWRLYDVNIRTLPKFKEERYIESIFSDPYICNYWVRNFEKIYRNEIDTWDYQWTYCIWANNGLSIIPNTNLITNIGFDGNATHTKSSKTIGAHQEAGSLDTLQHPTFIAPHVVADNYSTNMLYSSRHGIIKKIIQCVKYFIH
jgi:hypothetical protein